MTNDILIGAWKLESFRIIRPNAPVIHPFGEGPAGILVYDSCGYMNVVMMKRGMPLFKSEDPFMATEEERAGVFAGFLSYGGKYRISDGVVIHVPEVSSFPNWIGKELIRDIKLSGDDLTLTTPKNSSGEYAELVWRRVK